MKARWNAEADGPYVHVDEIIEWFETIEKALVDQLGKEGPVIADLISKLGSVWVNFRSEATRDRLHAVVNRVDVNSLADDLLLLRDELADEETP